MKQEHSEQTSQGLSAQFVAQALGGEVLTAPARPGAQSAGEGHADLVFTTVVTDSREAQPGSLYFARVGENADGHDYIVAAITAGARGIVVSDLAKTLQLLADHDPNPATAGAGMRELAIYLVPDVTAALGELARAHLERLRDSGEIAVIGITGSVGKTTTKDLLAGICSRLGPTIAPRGSFNNEVGMPLTVLSAGDDTRYLILEMGASGPGHLHYLGQIAPVDIGVELRVGNAHLAGFGSRAAVGAAKAELLEHTRSWAVLNADDDIVAQMPTHTPALYYTTGSGQVPAGGKVLTASAIELDASSRPACTLTFPDGATARIQLGLVGAHNVANALAAAGVAWCLGIAVADISAGLSERGAASAHRLAVAEVGGVTYIDDSYNANLESMRAALLVGQDLHSTRPGRYLAILGQMLELGAESYEIHAAVGRAAVAAGVDICVTVGEEAQPLHAAVRNHAEAIHVDNSAQALNLVRELIQPGDTVLLKGSNGSGIWRLADALLEGK